MSNNPLAFDDCGADPNGDVDDIDDEAYNLAYEEGRQAAVHHWNPFAAPENPYQPADRRAHAWALGFRNEYDDR